MGERKLIRDLMSVGVPTCKLDTPIVDIARFLLEQNVEEMVVLGESGEGLGVVGYPELARAYTREDARQLKAEDVMREGVPELPPDIPLKAAAQMLLDQGIAVAYMTHNAGGIIYPASRISLRHFVRHLAAESDEDIKDLGIAAARKAPLEQFIERRDAARRRAGQKGKSST
ncbi:MAG: CBS domain-containing protein [Anaerolineae bacterium]|nr:MAG: CBS domain-containing protein [Anaerolineae bacterium]